MDSAKYIWNFFFILVTGKCGRIVLVDSAGYVLLYTAFHVQSSENYKND